MPYIPKGQKDKLDKGASPENVGELTYVLYKTCLDYIDGQAPARFECYAGVLGALESTKAELYRRRIAPYEDAKILENGDVN